MSKVPAHHELIPNILQLRDEVSPKTFITVNGDIEDRQQGMQIIEDNPGLNGIMIGRGVFHNPFCFETSQTEHSKSELIGLLHIHLNLYDHYSQQTQRPYDTLKRFFKIYIREFDGAAEIRDKLMHSKSTNEARLILNSVS